MVEVGTSKTMEELVVKGSGFSFIVLEIFFLGKCIFHHVSSIIKFAK